jgi:hypothetical protein
MMDMHFRLLTVISDRNESLAAFHVLKESLRKEAQVFADHLIGWQAFGAVSFHGFEYLGRRSCLRKLILRR